MRAFGRAVDEADIQIIARHLVGHALGRRRPGPQVLDVTRAELPHLLDRQMIGDLGKALVDAPAAEDLGCPRQEAQLAAAELVEMNCGRTRTRTLDPSGPPGGELHVDSFAK
jgi:hypothetical protein